MSAEATHRPGIAQWTTWAPILGAVVLAATWGRSLPGVVAVLVTAALFGAVLAAVHHAEVITIDGDSYRTKTRRQLVNTDQ